MTDLEEYNLKQEIHRLERELYSSNQSRNDYKRLYEKERATINDRVALRETDKTRLLEIRDFIEELLSRWNY